MCHHQHLPLPPSTTPNAGSMPATCSTTTATRSSLCRQGLPAPASIPGTRKGATSLVNKGAMQTKKKKTTGKGDGKGKKGKNGDETSKQQPAKKGKARYVVPFSRLRPSMLIYPIQPPSGKRRLRRPKMTQRPLLLACPLTCKGEYSHFFFYSFHFTDKNYKKLHYRTELVLEETSVSVVPPTRSRSTTQMPPPPTQVSNLRQC